MYGQVLNDQPRPRQVSINIRRERAADIIRIAFQKFDVCRHVGRRWRLKVDRDDVAWDAEKVEQIGHPNRSAAGLAADFFDRLRLVSPDQPHVKRDLNRMLEHRYVTIAIIDRAPLQFPIQINGNIAAPVAPPGKRRIVLDLRAPRH